MTDYDKETDAELDALVAERVMGEGYAARYGVATKTEGHRSSLWSPTTDPDDRDEVWAKMKDSGPLWHRFVVFLEELLQDSEGGWPDDRAVCIAALRALEK